MRINDILDYARELKASDIHFVSGKSPVFRIDGKLHETTERFEKTDYSNMLYGMLSQKMIDVFQAGSDIDFAFVDEKGFRYRVNAFRAMTKVGIVMRLLSSQVPEFKALGLPEVSAKFAQLPRGLVLVTGPTGSGKSTTIASIINYAINKRNVHIITIEDPVEYVFESPKSVITQREVGADTRDFKSALRSSLREDPDIIFVGEMRDYETMSAAITAAETGHLVFSTLHTTSAAKSVDRIIDVFPSEQQPQVRSQLSSVLKGIISQQLVPKKGGGRAAAFEVMVCTDAISNMIRDDKTYQINSLLQMGGKEGMMLMDKSLADLVNSDTIEFEDAMEKSVNIEDLKRFIANKR